MVGALGVEPRSQDPQPCIMAAILRPGNLKIRNSNIEIQNKFKILIFKIQSRFRISCFGFRIYAFPRRLMHLAQALTLLPDAKVTHWRLGCFLF